MNTTEILSLLFYGFLGAAAIQILLIWVIYGQLAFKKTQPLPFAENDFPPLSIIISARNEHHNLLHKLKHYLNQDYPEFEVVVVNDQSVDDSEFYLQSLQQEHPNLKVVNIKNPVVFFKGKKFPLSIGIKSARYDTLVLSDADCFPSSPQWLKHMAIPYHNPSTDIVLGYGAYRIRKGLLNYIIRYETLRTAMNYFSLAIVGLPYMGVGRNLSYKRALFYKGQGFSKHYKIPSGDDDLFVNQNANRKNTAVVVHPDAVTISEPKKSFVKYWQQKRRHLSAGKHYKRKHIFILSLIDVSFWLMLLLSIGLIVTQQNLWIVVALLCFRYASFIFVVKRVMNKFGEKKLLLISPIVELIVQLIIPLVLLTGIFYRNVKWK